jgi:hypothetical protein
VILRLSNRQSHLLQGQDVLWMFPDSPLKVSQIESLQGRMRNMLNVRKEIYQNQVSRTDMLHLPRGYLTARMSDGSMHYYSAACGVHRI